MIVRATFKSSNGLYNLCLIQLVGTKLGMSIGLENLSLSSFSRHFLRFTLFAYCILICLAANRMLAD